MPEELPTPKKSLKQIEKEELKKISGGAKLKSFFKKDIRLKLKNRAVYY